LSGAFLQKIPWLPTKIFWNRSHRSGTYGGVITLSESHPCRQEQQGSLFQEPSTMTNRFADLMHAFGTALGLPEPEKLARNTPFSINDIVFCFRKPPSESDQPLMLFVDFGPIPKGNEAAVYYQLLRENYLEFPTKNASYCVSSRTGNVVYARAVATDALTVDTLAVIVAKLVEQVRYWRLDHADGRTKIAPQPMRRPAFVLPLQFKANVL
jgi:hypothetical protein